MASVYSDGRVTWQVTITYGQGKRCRSFRYEVAALSSLDAMSEICMTDTHEEREQKHGFVDEVTISCASGRTPGEDLTARQQATLEAIIRHHDVHGYSPTVRELGRAIDVPSTNGVVDHLRALERKGWIERTPGEHRAIRVLHYPSVDQIGEAA